MTLRWRTIWKFLFLWHSPCYHFVEKEKILQFLTEHQVITRKEAQALLNVSQSTAGRVLKAMVDNGQIKQFGGSRTTRYELPKK